MTYFNRRNNYQIEYSGHEDVSKNLRSRIYSIINKFTTTAVSSYGSSRPWSMQYKNLIYVVQKEFPSEHPLDIVENGDFVKFFTVVEIFWDAVKKLQGQRSAEAQVEMFQAFILSGSVYQINLRNGKIELIVEKDFAEKLKKTETVLKPYEKAYRIFFEAAGNLFGKKAKPKDIVRDIYVAAESYLKEITKESQYENAVKKLNNEGIINGEQKSILEKLYAYRSNTEGTTHAGDKSEPNELDALWFMDTMSAQLRYIGNKK